MRRNTELLPPWPVIGILFLTALCTLLLEIVLTRVLSVVMWYHFTFAVISVSLLGIAVGAMHCYRRVPSLGQSEQNSSRSDFWHAISRGLNLFSLAILLPIALMIFWIRTPTFSLGGAVLLLAYFLTCAAPFVTSGYLTAAIFRSGSSRLSVLYAADLLGGSLGCLLAIPFLNYLGGIGSLLAVSLILAVASTLLALRGSASKRRLVSFSTAAMVLTVSVLQGQTGRIDLQTVKLNWREQLRSILEVKWNSHSRLAVLDYFNPGEQSGFPFLSWGLSEHYAGWLPRQYLITIDGASETPITELREDIRVHEYLAWDITSLPYHLRPRAKALVIGAGGGRDVLTALWFGSRDITGVELNRGIVDWVRGSYADFAGHLYTHPAVRIIVDDGRNFVRASSETYDVLQISMIDTFAATAAGAYTLSENNLYTAQAFDEYLDHLTDEGILSINRFFLDPPQQTLRVVTLAREALARRGIRHAPLHIAVVRKAHPLGNNGLVMIKKAPFTIDEVEKIERLSTQAGYEQIALPGRTLANPFTAYLNEAVPERFYRTYPFDVRPPSDDRPFFFNTFKISALRDSLQLRGRIESLRVYNFDAVFILFVLLVLTGTALLLFIFLPLVQGSRRANPPAVPRLPVAKLAYFVWVGLGFILVEIVWIQRFHLYLGHPVYSLAVVLVSILAFSGLGSGWTTRCADRQLARWLAIACGAILLLVISYESVWGYFLAQTLGMPLWSRIALTAALILPLGLCMGMPYPLGLRAISAETSDGLPWIWAVNAAASVLGSILAFTLAMVAGFRIVLLAGGICYLGALISARWLFPRAKPSSALLR